MVKTYKHSYIIKNCPCNVTTEDMCDWENTNETYCQDCTDCVLKQIVEKCNEQKDIEDALRYKTNGYMLAKNILELLDIQEVE